MYVQNQPSPAGYNASTSDSSNGVPITQPVSPLPWYVFWIAVCRIKFMYF